jgi:hypothetical protein
MATHRCNNCDLVFDTQKPTSGAVVLESHGASDCPGCGGEAHKSRSLLPHHKLVDEQYRAIPDPRVIYVTPLPMAAGNNALIQELFNKLQQQLDAEKRRGDEMQKAMDRLASLPLRNTPASAVVEGASAAPAATTAASSLPAAEADK